MATQEERLTAVEKFTKDAAAHIRETEENTTILLGVIRSQGQDIRRLVEQGARIEDRLNQMYDEINAHTLLLHQLLDRLPAKE